MSLRTFLGGNKTCGIIENFLLSIKPISKSLQMITPQDFLLASKICQKIFHNFFNSCRKSKTDRDLFKYLKCYLNLLRLTRFAHFLIKSVRSCLQKEVTLNKTNFYSVVPEINVSLNIFISTSNCHFHHSCLESGD